MKNTLSSIINYYYYSFIKTNNKSKFMLKFIYFLILNIPLINLRKNLNKNLNISNRELKNI